MEDRTVNQSGRQFVVEDPRPSPVPGEFAAGLAGCQRQAGARIARFAGAGFNEIYVDRVGPDQRRFIDFCRREVVRRMDPHK